MTRKLFFFAVLLFNYFGFQKTKEIINIPKNSCYCLTSVLRIPRGLQSSKGQASHYRKQESKVQPSCQSIQLVCLSKSHPMFWFSEEFVVTKYK